MSEKIEYTESWRYALLGAQTDLITYCGGIGRVMALTGYSKGQVGRWNGGVDRDLMPLGVVLMLEGDCGRPALTTVMAGFNRRTLGVAEDGAAAAQLEAQVAGLVEQAGHLVAETVKARADGVVTPNEAARLRAISAKIQDLNTSVQEALAGTIAGDKVVVPARFRG